jgi:hypothetical protein
VRFRLVDLYAFIRELYAEKEELDRAIAALEGMQTDLAVVAHAESKKRGRKSMRPEERREVSERMKKYWAKRHRQTVL